MRAVGNPGAVVAAALVLSGSLACRKAAEPAEKRYPLTGVVSSVNRAVREAIVAHDDIPGFMPAMTMPFPIKDDTLLATLHRGDQIAGTLVVGETYFRLEDVKVTRKAPKDVPPAPSPSAGAEPRTGDLAPDVALVDQDGQAIHLSDFRGKALAVTFIFTRCPLPDFCPRMGAHFGEIDAALGRDAELGGKVRLLTVTFDPKFDTPAVLRAWGKRYVPSFDRHTLATGDPAEIKRLATFLSVEYDEEEKGNITHNLRTAVIDKDGRLYRLHRGHDWTPAALLADLRTAALS